MYQTDKGTVKLKCPREQEYVSREDCVVYTVSTATDIEVIACVQVFSI